MLSKAVRIYAVEIEVLPCYNTLLAKDWLGLRVSYNCKRICHHCYSENTDGFVQVPSALGSEPRRDFANFTNECLQDENPRR